MKKNNLFFIFCIVFFVSLSVSQIYCSGGFEKFISLFPEKIKLSNNIHNFNHNKKLSEGPGPDGDRLLEFFPKFEGNLTSNSNKLSYEGECFEKIEVTYTQDSEGWTVEMQGFNRKSILCRSDLYIVGTRAIWNVMLIEQTNQIYTAKSLFSESEQEKEWIEQYGAQIFLIQGGVIGFIEDVKATMKLFNATYETEESIKLLHDYMNVTLINRTLSAGETYTIIPDESEIQSGDILYLFKFGSRNGGFNSIEYFGTGGPADHVATILKIDGEFFVTESIDVGGNYLNSPGGIIKTPYREWMQNMKVNGSGWLVNYMRLSKDKQALFNETAAVQWFKSIEGSPYGFRNYLFTWLDILLGEDSNVPVPLYPQFLPMFFTLIDRFDPKDSKLMWGLAMNKRYYSIVDPNNQNPQPYLNIDQLFGELLKHKIDIFELLEMPEQDSWRYDGKVSLVCDTYSMSLYDHANVFPKHITFQYTEMTPLDAYSLNLYANYNEWQKPKGCSSNDQFPWCQISGQYYLELNGANTVEPYNNMFENCGGNPSNNYYRAPHC